MTAFAIAVLLIAGAVTLYAIWRVLQRDAHPDDSVPAIALAIALLVMMGVLDARDKRIAADEAIDRQQRAAGYLAREHARITVDLNQHCPPRTDGHTDQVVMLITSQADQHPEVNTCLRTAQRPQQHAKGKP
jgi:hypothetical protein